MNSTATTVPNCHYFTAGVCRSCPHLDVAYAQQVEVKTERVRAQLTQVPAQAWLPTQTSVAEGFRNKAKMVVSGTARNPQLGILDADLNGIDLCGCPLYSPQMRAVFPYIKQWIRELGISPYNVATKVGELKQVLLTESPNGEFMLRFVLRSHRHVGRLGAYVDVMLEDVPALRVVSANILPQHVALSEGEEEIILHGEYLRMALGQVALQLPPQAFFQTNTRIARAMYVQARRWASALQPARALDLFCGVGGFALSIAPECEQVVGVEITPAAIKAARYGARKSGIRNAWFFAADAGLIISEGAVQNFSFNGRISDCDLVVVNPPRRGIGASLCGWLEASNAKAVIYSSCNPASLAADLDRLPNFKVVRARIFDMFPGTDHAEVMTLLVRR